MISIQCIDPEKQVAHGETFIHGIEKVPDLGCRPDKGPLNIRQADFANVDVFNQLG